MTSDRSLEIKKISMHEFDSIKMIGIGGFSKVYEGTFNKDISKA